MTRKTIPTLLGYSILLMGCLTISKAQEVKPTLKPEISAAKRALIKQILELTNSKQSTEAMLNVQFEEMEKHLPDIEWQAISSMQEIEKLTPAQRAEIRTKINESSARVGKRVRELFVERIDMQQLVEDISYPIHDKYFTEAELQDLINFYKSPTGKKLIEVMPALFADSIAKASEMIMPKVQGIMSEIQKDETKRIEQEVEALLKPASKPPVVKKRPSRPRP